MGTLLTSLSRCHFPSIPGHDVGHGYSLRWSVQLGPLLSSGFSSCSSGHAPSPPPSSQSLVFELNFLGIPGQEGGHIVATMCFTVVGAMVAMLPVIQWPYWGGQEGWPFCGRPILIDL